MPHDKFGKSLSKGDLVTVDARVDQVHSGEDDCNLMLTVLGPETQYLPTLSLNSKLVEYRTPVAGHSAPVSVPEAITTLEMALDTAENNAKVAATECNSARERQLLERAKQLRAAIEVLQAASAKSAEPVPVPPPPNEPVEVPGEQPGEELPEQVASETVPPEAVDAAPPEQPDLPETQPVDEQK